MITSLSMEIGWVSPPLHAATLATAAAAAVVVVPFPSLPPPSLVDDPSADMACSAASRQAEWYAVGHQ